MRSVIVILSVLLIHVGTAYATEPALPSSNTNKYCESIGRLAAIIMTHRQNEVPMSEVMKLDVPETENGLRDAFVIAAYERPSFSTDKHRKRAIDEFRNYAELECFKSAVSD